MIFLYIGLIILLTPTVLYGINRITKNGLEELNSFEKVACGLIGSFLLYIIYLFLIGIIGIPYHFYTIIFPFIINIVGIVFCPAIRKNLYFKLKIPKKWNQKNIIITILGIMIATYLIYFISSALANTLLYPDEFSVWALNAKNIFMGKKMDFFINTGLENYPNFLPLLYSGFYTFIDHISENSIRIFSSIYMIIGVIGLIGIAKRKKINLIYLFLLLLLIFITYGGFFEFTSSSYGDTQFMVTYTLGMLYLFEWLAVDRKKIFLWISSINLMSCCFMKTDGLFLMAIPIFLFALFMFCSKWLKIKKVTFKQATLYHASILWLPLLWKVYNKIAHFPTHLSAGAGSVFELHLEFLVPLFQNMRIQFYDCLPWVLLLVILLLGYFVFYQKLNHNDQVYINLCSLTVMGNVVFLIFCYLFVFGGEAVIAASFIRYMTRVILIMGIACLIIVKPYDQERGSMDA